MPDGVIHVSQEKHLSEWGKMCSKVYILLVDIGLQIDSLDLYYLPLTEEWNMLNKVKKSMKKKQVKDRTSHVLLNPKAFL